MAAATGNAGPRFAPSDPTLPPPWRALVDGTTGYIYYWNTETNATQYEKPVSPMPPSSKVPQQAAMQSSVTSGTGQLRAAASELQNSRMPEHVSAGPPKSAVNIPSHMYNNSISMHGNGGHMGGVSSGGMSNMPMRLNTNESTYGGNSMPPHVGGSGPGNARSYPGTNTHAASGGNLHNGVTMNLQMQPKMTMLPQRQQVVGGMHMVPQPSRQANPVVSGNSASGNPHPYKRPANDFPTNESDPQKRQRLQGFTEPSQVLDTDGYRRQHEITIVGDNVPEPFMTFDSANFPPEITRELNSAGFLHPTPIQAQSWPLALQGRDIVAIAKTGSGKTLGYLLPAFLHLSRCRANSRFGPIVLVLAPTRELATQIQDEALKFGSSSRISCTCVYGGAPKGPQLRDLDRGADIVIATPGRLNDFLELKKVSLRQISYLVLDEADRMLDMGFEPQIRKIVKEIPSRRQTLMFTATWPKEVRKISADLLQSPVQVNIGNTDQLVANKAITQLVEVVSPFEKHRRLEQILRSQEPGSKIIIFCSTKKMCDQLARSLGRGFGAAAIHGDKSQSERDYVLAQFKTGRSPILVATDVAARGLDIKDIRVVINFDFPTGVEDYVHRIGRTGRAGATGVAFTFFADQDSKYAKELIAVLEGANQKVPLELRNLAAKSFPQKGRGGRWENAAGGIGHRDGDYNRFGGGRGGGRGDVPANAGSGGRSGWGMHGHSERRDKIVDQYDKERFSDKNGIRDRFADERSRGRNVTRSFNSRDRARSYSRSYSRSPSRSRGRSHSRSRSPTHSYDKYSDGYNRRSRSPYKSRGSYRSRSPRSRSLSNGHSPKRGKVTSASDDSHQSGPKIQNGKSSSDRDTNTTVDQAGTAEDIALYKSEQSNMQSEGGSNNVKQDNANEP